MIADAGMTAPRMESVGPSWRADAKWVLGILLTLSLSLTLAVASMVQLTSEESAVEALSLAMALGGSRLGLDDITEIAYLRLRLMQAESVRPIEGLRITLTEKDMIGWTPREIRLSIFRQLAEPLYRDGIAGLMPLAETPEAWASVAHSVELLRFLGRPTHQRLLRLLVPLGLVCLLLAVGVLACSRRFGRLASPALAFIAASGPGTAASAVALRVKPASAPLGETEVMAAARHILSNLLPAAADVVWRIHVLAMLVGIVLLLLAAVGSVVSRVAGRS